MTSEHANNSDPQDTSGEVAGVLSALGQLMRDLRAQDLALQDAVSKLAAATSKAGKEVVHIQHVDLITQTHDDLARFLPELAACLEHTDFDQEKLAQKLRLQSLKDQLLVRGSDPDDTANAPGDVSFF
ncbi:MAG: hypothetical protein HKN27_17610 [Silicimonas sp.]|nr:hypothetical protein [Silicimonas sp.]